MTESDKRTMCVASPAGFGALMAGFYKREPLYPRPDSNLNNFNLSSKLRVSSCQRCFPQILEKQEGDCVDLLEFSAFGGLPHPLIPGVKPPSRWAADLRYTIATPLPHKYPAIHDKVLHSVRVQSVIDSMVSSRDTERRLQSRAAGFFLEIRAYLSKIVCKICGYLLFKVFRRLCSRILVVPAQMEAVKKAEKTGLPLVYLPLHQSHLDYLLITWNSWHFGLRLPHIASGDNLNLSGFGWLLRATGAFFIRRRLSPEEAGGRDELYRAVLHSYIDEILANGLTLEFFLEGTRNRFGKPYAPKNGLISNVVEDVQQGVIEDCYLVPIAITYDQVAEGIFLNELMGIPKVRENLWTVLKGIVKGFGKSSCGAVRMNYGTPVLLSEYIASLSGSVNKPKRLKRLPTSFSYRELLPWNAPDLPVDRGLVRGIGLHVIHEAQSLASIHQVSIVAAVLLCKFRLGAERSVIEGDVEWLCERLAEDGQDVVGWCSKQTSGRAAVEYALGFLANSVEMASDTLRPLPTHRAFVRLAYCRNAILPHIPLKAAVGLALSSVKPNTPVEYETVVETVIDICELYHFEVLFCKPCDSLREQVELVLGDGQFGNPTSGYVRYEQDGHEESWEESRRGGTLVIRDILSHNILVFYSNLLRPFLQSYYIVFQRLLTHPHSDKEATFIRETIKETLANTTGLPFPLMLEAVNSDSMKNCLAILRERGVVEAALPAVHLVNAPFLEEASERICAILEVPYCHA